jgi:hypothetical protein
VLELSRRGDSTIQPGPEREQENARAVASALRGAPAEEGPPSLAKAEVALERTDVVTQRLEKLRDFVTTLAKGLPVDPETLAREVAMSLDLVERLWRSRRTREAVRLGRVLCAALLLLCRWADLLRTLGIVLSAARELGDRAVEAWVLNERGTLAATVGDPSSQGLLRKALHLRRALGDREGAELTAGNLHAAGLSAGSPLLGVPAKLQVTITAHSAGAVAAGVAVTAAIVGGGFAVGGGWYGIGGGDGARDFGPPARVQVTPFDGASYKVLTSGEFIAARSTEDDLEVQERIERAESGAGIITAVAARVSGSRVVIELEADPRLRVDGQPAPERVVRLPDGGMVRQSDGSYEVIWPDRSSLDVAVDSSGPTLNLELFPSDTRRGQMSGLLGDNDGNGANDVATREGQVFTNPTKDDYQAFTESWRVREDESLFE